MATDEASDSRVDYGQTTSYESGSAEDGVAKTIARGELGRLSPGTQYHFKIFSHDSQGNGLPPVMSLS